MKRIILSLLLLPLLASCDVEPSKIDAAHAAKLGAGLTYFKDTRTGLCFAAIATRKTGKTDQSGMGLTMVPCEEVKALLGK